jgi:hypothetical protein
MYYIDRTTRQYPLDRWTVMERNPEISKPINWDDAICEALNVWPVYPRPSQTYPNWDQKCIESNPIEIDGVWYQNWLVVPLTPEELDESTQQQWNVVIQTQETILSSNVEILPSGNVVPAPAIEYDYSLPSNLDNIVIQSGNVYVDGIEISTTVVIVNDEPADISINQAIVSDDISVLPDGTVQISSTGSDEVADTSNLIVVASGNVEIVLPYPQEIAIPYTGPEATAEQYQEYISAVSNVTAQPNPFEITWPASPFYGNLSNAASSQN